MKILTICNVLASKTRRFLSKIKHDKLEKGFQEKTSSCLYK